MTRPNVSILALGPTARRQAAEQIAAQLAKPEKRPKFGNATVVVDGYRFDSKREAERYLALVTSQRAGAIRELRVQPAWRLEVNGEFITDYVADFAYKCSDGFAVVEDVKSKATRTPAYLLKRKLLFALHRIIVQEAA